MNTLDVVSLHPDRFKVAGLAAGANVELLAEQARKFGAGLFCVRGPEEAERLAALTDDLDLEIRFGAEGYQEVAALEETDIVVSALVGFFGVAPTLAALKAGKDVALANKEVLVAAGELVTRTAGSNGARLLPVDSEHSAIFQSLAGAGPAEVSRLILTASGGPFLDSPLEELSAMTPEQALKHPKWSMGRKVTIDSATMMNKGLEVIEARWLFEIEPERIEVLIHPQSIVHSMVEFISGSVIAQLSPPDMRLPIACALGWPERLDGGTPRLNAEHMASLTFREVEPERYPALALAYRALDEGGTSPAVMNGANEEAVEAFLGGKIGFRDIPRTVEAAMKAVPNAPADGLAEIVDADRRGRAEARRIMGV